MAQNYLVQYLDKTFQAQTTGERKTLCIHTHNKTTFGIVAELRVSPKTTKNLHYTVCLTLYRNSIPAFYQKDVFGFCLTKQILHDCVELFEEEGN